MKDSRWLRFQAFLCQFLSHCRKGLRRCFARFQRVIRSLFGATYRGVCEGYNATRLWISRYIHSTIDSRLGRRTVVLFLLAGLTPLLLFTLPLYYHTARVIESEVQSNLLRYTRAARSQLYRTVNRASHQLVYLSVQRRTQRDSTDLFQRIRSVPLEQVENLPFPLTGRQWSRLREGELVLSKPYRRNGTYTMALLTRLSEEDILVGEIRSKRLWSAIHQLDRENQDDLFVMDSDGNLLSATLGSFQGTLSIPSLAGGMPERPAGTDRIKGIGEVHWAASRISFEELHGPMEWSVLAVQKKQTVQSFPPSLIRFLAFCVFMALTGLLLVSMRFAYQLYQPVGELSHSMDRLARGDWTVNPSVQTGDELEKLAEGFRTMRDKLKESEEQIRRDATHDRLTDLPNRILLEDRIEQSIAFAQNHLSYSFGVIMISVDRHQLIIESLGHSVGDRVQQMVAERITECVEQKDMVASLGVTEFAVFLDDVIDPGRAGATAQQIQDAFESPLDVEGHNLTIQLSMGIVMYREDHKRPDDILQDGQTVLDQARDSRGSEPYRRFRPSMRRDVRGRLELEMDLIEALEQEQFRVYFQPIVDLKRRRIHEWEALIRWPREPGDWESPQRFIPLAEENGMITKLDRWVLDQSIRQAQQWGAGSGGNGRVSVNLSAQSLLQTDLIQHVRRQLDSHDVPPTQLNIEITERELIEQRRSAIQHLEQLRKHGITVSMDDFGTGHSSLDLLRDLPIDGIKVDRSFVHGIHDRQDHRAIVAAITGLADQLHLEVVAEGVETSSELTSVRQVGCRFAQGYLFSRAVPPDRTSELQEIFSLPFASNDTKTLEQAGGD